MNCHTCKVEIKRFAKHRNGLQRYRCMECKKTYTEDRAKPPGNMTLPQHKAALAIQLLVGDCSVRTVERITDMHRDTILRLLVLVGEKCERIMAKYVRNVKVWNVECDEIWCYVFKKEGHKTKAEQHDESIGDANCFVAIERHTKLVLNFALGGRTQATTNAFIEGMRDSIAPKGNFQITMDGFSPYKTAIPNTVGHRVDFAQLIKVYQTP